MCNWRSWIWPGLITTAVLTALTGWFLSIPVEEDLAGRVGAQLKSTQGWSAVDFDGRDATILGEAAADTQVVGAASLALATYGVRVVANGATVVAAPVAAAAPPAPYIWAATSGLDGVNIEGSVPSKEVASASVELATRRFVKAQVVDAQSVLDGAPDGFAEAQGTALKTLSYLTAGKITIADKIISVEGTVPSDAALALVSSQLKAGLPAGYELISTVTVAAITAPAPAAVAAAVPYVWSARSSGDGVKLEGSVLSGAVGQSILALAASSFVGKSVTSAQVALNNSPASFATAQGEALKGLAQLQEGTASITDKIVTLTGIAASDEVKSAVTNAVSSALPAGYTLLASDITVAVPEPATVAAPPVPYVWTASSREGVVTLDGSSPTTDAAAAAMDLAARRFVKADIKNTQVILTSAPEGFTDAQQMSLKTLSYLTEGRAVVSDRTVEINGVAVSESMKALVIKNATASVPAGYAVTTSIMVVEPVVVVEPAPVAASAPSTCIADVAALLAAEQISFETNKSNINASSAALLVKISTSLASCPDVKFEIGGHTDADGSIAYNQKLSNDRASAVGAVLRSSGLDQTRISSLGYGESAPIAANDSEENKAKNRRIEFRAVE